MSTIISPKQSNYRTPRLFRDARFVFSPGAGTGLIVRRGLLAKFLGKFYG